MKQDGRRKEMRKIWTDDNIEELKSITISEAKRIAKMLGNRNFNQDEYRLNIRESCSLGQVKRILDWTFNDIKKQSGLECSQHRPRRCEAPAAKKVLGLKRNCNKCGKKYNRTDENRLACTVCKGNNFKHTETPGYSAVHSHRA